MKRVFLIVLDSFGIGAMPDAESFGDVGVNTLRACATSQKLDIPNMTAAGLGNIDGVTCLPKAAAPTGAFARLRESSMGKDTTIGHWEIAGVISPQPLPTFPNGFPKEVLDAFEKETGRGVLCNLPYSGTDVIRDYGEEQRKTGKWIVYTSADSVFQVAAHEEWIPLQELYDACRKARKLLQGKYGVGRVIARPYVGDAEHGFKRTANRHDYAAAPPSANTAMRPVTVPPAAATSSSMARREPPVEMTSSTRRMRLPRMMSASSRPRNSFWTPAVVMDWSSTWMGSGM